MCVYITYVEKIILRKFEILEYVFFLFLSCKRVNYYQILVSAITS